MNVGELQLGRILSTSYGSGPYILQHIYGPCTCTEYVASLSGSTKPSEAHYHLTVHEANPRPGKRDIRGWLAGYRDDGTSVWCDDRLIFGELAPGTQQQLF
jgi:hypothetical protein